MACASRPKACKRVMLAINTLCFGGHILVFCEVPQVKVVNSCLSLELCSLPPFSFWRFHHKTVMLRAAHSCDQLVWTDSSRCQPSPNTRKPFHGAKQVLTGKERRRTICIPCLGCSLINSSTGSMCSSSACGPGQALWTHISDFPQAGAPSKFHCYHAPRTLNSQ